MGKYRCLFCGAEYDTLAELREHMGEKLACAAGSMLECFDRGDHVMLAEVFLSPAKAVRRIQQGRKMVVVVV